MRFVVTHYPFAVSLPAFRRIILANAIQAFFVSLIQIGVFIDYFPAVVFGFTGSRFTDKRLDLFVL
ncbi:hypothetical protein HX891_01995 [Pseudomonas reactans]|uniref:hypothetical protein n=1 Tax=Pseudomonas reactans TaxID=117680 RepID=UPI0015B933A6|nr:hypothetical protein [Pseudomonas reactans]NWD79133.1 hypothetical protein [Pseudomonas reactans]